MTSDEVKQSIRNWCSSDDDLEIGSDRFEPTTDFAFTLRAGTQSVSPVELVVLKGDSSDRVTIRRNVTLSGDSVDAARKLIDSRPGSVTASVERSGLDTTVVAQTYVYLDGLTQHTFMQAVSELGRTGALLDGLGGAATETADVAAAAEATPVEAAVVEAAVTPEPVATPEPVSSFPSGTVQQPTIPQPAAIPSGFPVGQPLPQPSFTPQPAQPALPVQAQPAPQPSFAPQPAQPYQAQPVPQPAPAAQWVPSHSVPPQGLRAWNAPDPSGPVVANLAPGLPIQVAEVRGAWARVICSNGWTGWIDGRIIGVAA